MSDQLHDLYQREALREATGNYGRGEPYGAVAAQNVGVHKGGIYFEGFTSLWAGYSDYELLQTARRWAGSQADPWGPMREYARRITR